MMNLQNALTKPILLINRSHGAALIRNHRLQMVLLFLCLLMGFFLRLEVVGIWNANHTDSTARLVGDEPGYDNMARELLMGYGFTWPGRVPLYPIYLAVVYQVGNGSYNFAAYAQALLGVLSIALVYALGNRILGRLAGLIAASFAAFSYILIYQSFRILSENLYVPVLLLVMITVWDAFQKPSKRRFLVAGLLLGISNLVRPTLLLFPLFVLVPLWFRLGTRQTLRYGLIYVASSIVIVMPWIIHNYNRYQAIFALQTSNAILWQGSPEYYHLVRDEGFTYMQIWTEVLYGPGWQEHDPNSVEGDRYWTKRAIESIRSEPLTYLRYAAEKSITFWIGDPNADWNNTYIFNYQALIDVGFPHSEAQQYMIALILPIIALISVVVLRRHFWRLMPLYIFLAYFTLLHAATHAEARLSAPLQPYLLILIGGAIASIFFRQNTGETN